MPVPRFALISTSFKQGLDTFARSLVEMDFTILSTGGTARALNENAIPVMSVSAHTGAPEILGGRVKTLHPKVHGGILARRGVEADRQDMEREGIVPIDLVVVNLYPFEKTVEEGCSLAKALENIDIGGPCMIRAAAKSFEDVVIVVDPADYEWVADSLAAGSMDRSKRYQLACKAFAHTAKYDAAIVNYLSSREEPDAERAHFSRYMPLVLEKAQDLRYGENPHQRGAFYVESKTAEEPLISGAVQLQGKELSFNNILDANAALELVKEFDDTAAVIVKHTNPCGVATAPLLADAYRNARACDEVSAFGGVVALRREVDIETATLLAETFLEIVIAPAFSDDAIEVLQSKKGLRLLAVAMLATPKSSWRANGFDYKRVGGGLLVQESDRLIWGDQDPTVVTSRAPTSEEWQALRFGWTVVKHVKSNAIVYSRGDRLVGVGAGQMSRVDSARIGRDRATSSLSGAIVASDAFFPFRDGLDVAAAAGVTAAIQPGGSKRDDEVIAAANEHGMAMVFTSVRHFKH